MKKIYNRVMVFILFAISGSAAVAGTTSSFFLFSAQQNPIPAVPAQSLTPGTNQTGRSAREVSPASVPALGNPYTGSTDFSLPRILARPAPGGRYSTYSANPGLTGTSGYSGMSRTGTAGSAPDWSLAFSKYVVSPVKTASKKSSQNNNSTTAGLSGLTGPSAGKNRTADTLHLRTGNLKDNRQVKPYLIFAAPSFNISRKLMLGAGSSAALTYNNIESQYRVTFGNFNVSSPIHDLLTLSYSLDRDNLVTAKIFNVLGTEVTTLFSQYRLAGQHREVFNLADRVGSGIYILKLTAGNEQMAKRIQVL